METKPFQCDAITFREVNLPMRQPFVTANGTESGDSFSSKSASVRPLAGANRRPCPHLFIPKKHRKPLGISCVNS